MNNASIGKILDILITNNEETHAMRLLEHYINCESQWLGSWRPEDAQARREQLDSLRETYRLKVRDRLTRD